MQKLNESSEESTRFFASQISPTDAATALRLQAAIQRAYPGMTLTATRGLDLDSYEDLGLCRLAILTTPMPFVVYRWGGLDNDCIEADPVAAVRTVLALGTSFIVVSATWREGYDCVTYHWVLHEEEARAHAFILDVARATDEPRDAILVFHGNC